MKTVTLSEGKWNDIILILAKGAQSAPDQKQATYIHNLMIAILEGNGEEKEASEVIVQGYPNDKDHVGCIPPDGTLEKGFNTVLSYLAIYRPDYLRMIDFKNPTTTARDGYWLKHNYTGVTFDVPAPEFFHRFHIETIKSYPNYILDQRFHDK
jgi:hypothetical protein